ncbi:MAG: protease pro-enzyme activation domain-containing protein, partial [Acidobacteriota bacterium]
MTVPLPSGRLTSLFALVPLAMIWIAAPDVAPAAPYTAPGSVDSRVPAAEAGGSSGHAMRRVVLLGLHGRGEPGRFAGQVSDPSSRRYRQFLSPAGFRDRFSPSKADRRRVKRYLAKQRGVGKVELSSGRTVVLAVMTPNAGRRIFCAEGAAPPTGGLCRPKRLRPVVRQVSVGEVYERGGGQGSDVAAGEASANTGTPSGCQGAIKTGAFTPNQLATAYGVDELHSRGLEGSGVRVATLSSQEVDTAGFKTWGKCFGLRTPAVRQIAMPSAGPDTETAPEETVLDVEALASLAPGLKKITPIYVPLDQSFSHSFALFMYGALDPSRQGGELPDILSISDGVCENRFTTAQLRLGQRMLAEAASLGITALAASGDLGFRGCFTSARGASFPDSSRFVTGVGGTELTLTPGNEIAEQVVWSTYATQPQQ